MNAVLHNPTRERIRARATACQEHRWVPLAARAIADRGFVHRDELALILALCLLANGRDGRVLAMREQLAAVVCLDENALLVRLEALHRRNIVRLIEKGSYLVLTLQMLPNKPHIDPFSGPRDRGIANDRSAGQGRAAVQVGASVPAFSSPAENTVAGQKQSGGGSNGAAPEEPLDAFLDRLVSVLDARGERAAYRTLCARYPRAIVEEALQRVVNTPPNRIRKSKGALFTFLVKSINQQPRS